MIRKICYSVLLLLLISWTPAMKDSYMKDPQFLFELALKAEGITGKLAAVARSIYAQESGSGVNTKTSNAGAVGNMQVIPSTFKAIADKGWDIKNPMHNMRAGIRYVKEGFNKAGGDPALTGAYYYGGPKGLAAAEKGVARYDTKNPKAPNTLQYGQQIVARLTKALPNIPFVLNTPNFILNTPNRVNPKVSMQAAPVQVAQSAQAAPTINSVQQVAQEDPWLAFQNITQPTTTPVALAQYGNFESPTSTFMPSTFNGPQEVGQVTPVVNKQARKLLTELLAEQSDERYKGNPGVMDSLAQLMYRQQDMGAAPTSDKSQMEMMMMMKESLAIMQGSENMLAVPDKEIMNMRM